MRSAPRHPPAGGAYSQRFTDYAGIFFDDYAPDSAWIRERGTIHLPPLGPSSSCSASPPPRYC
jgi:hypothetical protein